MVRFRVDISQIGCESEECTYFRKNVVIWFKHFFQGVATVALSECFDSFMVICEVELAALDNGIFVDLLILGIPVDCLSLYGFIFVLIPSVTDDVVEVEVIGIDTSKCGLC